PLVSYPPKPVLLILPFPPPHGSDADAQYLCRLPPRDLLRHRLQHHFSHSHQSLHFRGDRPIPVCRVNSFWIRHVGPWSVVCCAGNNKQVPRKSHFGLATVPHRL